MDEIKKTLGGLINGRMLVEYLYDKTSDTARLATLIDGKIVISDTVEIDGELYAPKEDIRIWRDNWLRMANQAGDLARDSVVELDELRAYFKRWMVINDWDATMLSCYVLSTWMHDRYTSTPALRIIGRCGDGKSHLLKLLQGVCYRATIVYPDSSLYGIVLLCEQLHATLLVDGADEMDEERVSGMINNGTGAHSGDDLLRNNPNYGPRVLAMNRAMGGYNNWGMDIHLENLDAMDGRERWQEINQNWGEWEADAQRITNMLMGMRMKRWGELNQPERDKQEYGLLQSEAPRGARMAVATAMNLYPACRPMLVETLRTWWQYERKRGYTYILEANNLHEALRYILVRGKDAGKGRDEIDICLTDMAASMKERVGKQRMLPKRALVKRLKELGLISKAWRDKEGMHVLASTENAWRMWEECYPLQTSVEGYPE